jgi:hypothetical protein
MKLILNFGAKTILISKETQRLFFILLIYKILCQMVFIVALSGFLARCYTLPIQSEKISLEERLIYFQFTV